MNNANHSINPLQVINPMQVRNSTQTVNPMSTTNPIPTMNPMQAFPQNLPSNSMSFNTINNFYNDNNNQNKMTTQENIYTYMVPWGNQMVPIQLGNNNIIYQIGNQIQYQSPIPSNQSSQMSYISVLNVQPNTYSNVPTVSPGGNIIDNPLNISKLLTTPQNSNDTGNNMKQCFVRVVKK